MVEFGAGKKASSGPDADAPAEAVQARDGGAAFGAIVGQAEMKEALLAVGASDALEGLLLRGEKGTAKSTAVRALAALLPSQAAIADCPYGCPPDDAAAQCADCRDRADPPVEQRPVPFVTLPLGATRERVVGSLSVAEALSGEPEFEPGLLARANRGILYVDEVNLLDDHLVDVLLDAAASGVNRVERDGVSVTHPAAFTLIGTMNPEEGELRPQLRDRFALQATVTGCQDLDQRAAVVEQALARDEETDTADSAVSEATAAARERLLDARERLPDVALPEQFLTEIVELCRDAGVDGHRADIATARTARALAALDRRPKVLEPDVRRAAELTLPHRLQSTPFEDAPDAEAIIDDHFGDDGETAEGNDPPSNDDQPQHDAGSDGGRESDSDREGDSGRESNGGRESTDCADPNADEDGTGEHPEQRPDADSDIGTGGGDVETADTAPETDAGGNATVGNRSRSDGAGDGRGSAAGAGTEDSTNEQPHGGETSGARAGRDDDDAEQTPVVPGQRRPDIGDASAPDLDLPERGRSVDADDAVGSGRSRATPAVGNRGSRVRTERAAQTDRVDAAASVRAAAARGSDRVETRDLRRSVRSGDAGALVVFAVDASASMRGPLGTAKGVALELLRDAYQHRDEVALVTFAGDRAQVVLPPTDSVSHAARHLKELPSGDRTPLPAGLDAASDVLERADPEVGVVVLVTDGRANAVADGPDGTAGEADANDGGAAGSPTAATRAAARNLARRDAHVVVVDAGEAGRSLTGEITAITGGERVPLSSLTADRVGAAVERAREE